MGMNGINRTLIGRLASVVGAVSVVAVPVLLVAGVEPLALLLVGALAALGLGLWAALLPDEVLDILRGRQVRYGSVAVLTTIFFIGVLVLLYVVATRNEVSMDFTETQRFTLSNASQGELAGLQTSIHITGFYTANAIDRQENAAILLRQYNEATGGLVTFEFVDPNEQPTTAAAYGVQRDGELYAMREGDPPETAEFIASADERQITRAILKLIRAQAFKVYFVSGHGEYAIDDVQQTTGLSTANSLLADTLGLTTETLNLLAGPVPEDASAVLVVGPLSAYAQEEVDHIADYLDGGGRMMILADPNLPPDEVQAFGPDDPFTAMLWEKYRVRFSDDLIIAEVNFGNPFSPIADRVNGSHPVTQNLQQRPPVFIIARSIEAPQEERPAGVSVVDLVFTAAEDFGETDFEAVMSEPPVYENDPEVDTQGPLPMASAVQNNITQENEARLVLVGDANFVTNEMIAFPGNQLLFADAMDWLIEYTTEIEVEVVSDATRLPLVVSSNQQSTIAFLTIVVMPVAVLVIGAVVWFSRRQG